MNIDKYLPPPPPLSDTPFRIPFFGGYIIPEPRVITKIEMKLEDVAPVKAEPRRVKIQFYFKWFDFWIGFFIDTKKKILYIGLLPMIGIKIDLGG